MRRRARHSGADGEAHDVAAADGLAAAQDADGKCLAGHLRSLSNFAPKDWYEATNACAAEGKVLCGVEEPCSRSGCMYDHHYQWTGQECQAGDAGFAC